MTKNSRFKIPGAIVFIQEIRENGMLFGNTYKHRVLENYFTDFIDSKEIGMVLLRKNTVTCKVLLRRSDLIRKCVCLPYKESKIIITLLNDFDQTIVPI